MDKRPDRYRNSVVAHIYIEGAAADRPPSDFRLKNLCRWDIVEAICWHCTRTDQIDHRMLLRER